MISMLLAVRVARIFDGRDLVPGAGVVLMDRGRVVGVEPTGFAIPATRWRHRARRRGRHPQPVLDWSFTMRA